MTPPGHTAAVPPSLGPLRDVAALPGVTDVLVNGGDRVPGGHRVWFDRGRGLESTTVDLAGEDDVRALAVRLAAGAGRRLDDSMPWVDARLPGGIRLHAVVPPVTPYGTHLSLRLIGGPGFDLPALVAAGGAPPAWVPVLTALVRSRAAFLVIGGTGAGKTTLLAALLGLIPPSERIVLVEDVGELRPAHPHVVRLEARHANVEGEGAVTLEDLVRQALRMRPDRIVVGECRGAEVRELLSALNTGHAGGCGTLHANAVAEVPARLEALGSLAGLAPAAVRTQAAAALDAVVRLQRGPHGRRITEIGVFSPGGHLEAGGSEPSLVVRPALVADESDPFAPGRSGPGWPALARRLGLRADAFPPQPEADP
ncbi:MAG: TadA family conjugal transfer-associated ATPase [Actinomycetota bacterium]|nr:TadA family conjugal transfer-associated ATPase [Actinomycetota bacterium]